MCWYQKQTFDLVTNTMPISEGFLQSQYSFLLCLSPCFEEALKEHICHIVKRQNESRLVLLSNSSSSYPSLQIVNLGDFLSFIKTRLFYVCGNWFNSVKIITFYQFKEVICVIVQYRYFQNYLSFQAGEFFIQNTQTWSTRPGMWKYYFL